eukprot:634826_1
MSFGRSLNVIKNRRIHKPISVFSSVFRRSLGNHGIQGSWNHPRFFSTDGNSGNDSGKKDDPSVTKPAQIVEAEKKHLVETADKSGDVVHVNPELPKEVLALIVERPLIPGQSKVFTQPIGKLLKSGGYVAFFLDKKSVKQTQSGGPAASEAQTDGPAPGEATSPSKAPLPPLDEIHRIGTLAWVQSQKFWARPQEKSFIFIQTHALRPVRLIESLDRPRYVKVEYFEDPDYKLSTAEDKAYFQEINKLLTKVLEKNVTVSQQFVQMTTNRFDLRELIPQVSSVCESATNDELQELLECMTVKEKLSKLHGLLISELETAKMHERLKKEASENFEKAARTHMYQEQLKIIKRELGIEKDDKTALSGKFRDRIKELDVPKEAMDVIDEELEKLSFLEPTSSEFAGTRNYLDWLTNIPWGKFTKELFDIKEAQRILNEDHFGLQDVKDRIIEFIAVGKLCGAVPQGKILCLVGPPGVGKTSIGTSIARALGREFYRFSVGGLTDTAEIKGHRRTYVGAMPGKLIQCLKKTKCQNPLVLIDEIDKIGSNSIRGDPASALLEVLDPKQNHAFNDHYLDVEVDLSKTLFICTANVSDTIPPALADRMEFVRISGYIASEKMEIAQKYLIPEAMKECGIKDEQASIDGPALSSLIRWYCREAGVRNLQKKIQKILRKIAVKIVNGGQEAVTVVENNLEDFVGKRKFHSDRLYERTPVGVVMGLAWTSMGGATLYIESLVTSRSKKDSTEGSSDKSPKEGNMAVLKTTGNMGDVMSETSQIAQCFARCFVAEKIDPNNKFFSDCSVHVHVPEGGHFNASPPPQTWSSMQRYHPVEVSPAAQRFGKNTSRRTLSGACTSRWCRGLPSCRTKHFHFHRRMVHNFPTGTHRLKIWDYYQRQTFVLTQSKLGSL